MRTALPLALSLLLSTSVAAHAHHTATKSAAHGHAAPSSAATPTTGAAIAGLGNVHHAVSTKVPDAQRHFDQGLALCYGFNHDEAIRSFRRALQLDPTLAMAHWGVAYALGPNINLPVDAEREKQAAAEIARAKALSANATPSERDYIDALATRYAAEPTADRRALDVAFKEAMGALSKKYPDDLDAATLFAESAMNLRPWAYWNPDGTMAEGTAELVAALESVLRRDPDHIGANHYYIHAVEASPHPERATAQAHRLRTLAPAAGHLVHMPSHIYIRTGDYDAAAKLNDAAAGVDRSYIRRDKVQGVYPAMYFNHNLHFSAVSHAMAGRYADAIKSARELERNAIPVVKDMAMIEGFVPTPILIDTRFRRWKEVLAAPEAPAGQHITAAIRHFARGMAHASLGARDAALAEQQAMQASGRQVAEGATIGFNPVPAVLAIADGMLAARIAEQAKDVDGAVAKLRDAVKAEDALAYDEPPDWYLHVRESLGGVLLRAGRFAEAERVFREDLERHPRSGRSLFGLHAALEGRGDAYGASLVKRELDAAWKGADTKLAVADL